MVESLRDGALSVSQLARPHAMTLAAVGKHIAVLESAGILRSEKTGRVRTCAVVPDALREANAWISDQTAFWNARVDALDAYLEENP